MAATWIVEEGLVRDKAREVKISAHVGAVRSCFDLLPLLSTNSNDSEATEREKQKDITSLQNKMDLFMDQKWH